jgi:hypothetical protein
LELASAS